MSLDKYSEFDQKQLEDLIEQGVAKNEKGDFFIISPLIELRLNNHQEFLKHLVVQHPMHPLSSKGCFLLGKLKDVSAVEQLCTVLRGSDDVEACKMAAQALGELGIATDRVMYALTLALVMDPEFSVRIAAATAMAKIDAVLGIEYIVGFVGKRTDNPDAIKTYSRLSQALLNAKSIAEPDVLVRLNTIIQSLGLSNSDQED